MIFALKLLVFVLVAVAAAFLSVRMTTPEMGRGGQPTGRTETDVQPRVSGILAAFVLVLSFFVLQSGVSSMAAGYRGVVTRYGKVTGRTIEPGIYFVNPFADSVQEMDVQTHAHAAKAAAVSKDMQQVTTELTLNFGLDPARVGTTYENLRSDYVERVLVPTVQEAVKATTAAFSAEELITRRPVVRDQLDNMIKARLALHGMLVDQVSITDFDFSEEFNHAIEAKVTAVQNALKAQNDLEKIKFEAEQRVVTAKGEAEAIRIQAQSISAQGGESYVQLKWVEKWDGKLPTTSFGGGNNTPVLLNVPANR